MIFTYLKDWLLSLFSPNNKWWKSIFYQHSGGLLFTGGYNDHWGLSLSGTVWHSSPSRVHFVVAYQNLHAESAACPEVGSEIPGLVSTINYCREHKCQWISLLLHITTVSLIIRPQRLVHWKQFNAARRHNLPSDHYAIIFVVVGEKLHPSLHWSRRSRSITLLSNNLGRTLSTKATQFRENSFSKGHRSNGALIPLLNH